MSDEPWKFFAYTAYVIINWANDLSSSTPNQIIMKIHDDDVTS